MTPQNKDKLFLKKIFNKMSKLKGQLTQSDSMQTMFNSNQVKIKLTKKFRFKTQILN